MKKYQQLEAEGKHILFYNCKDVCRCHVNAITCLDHKTMYVTFDSERIVAICSLTFAGQATKEESGDGLASYFRFYEATGITLEFDNVVYVCDRSVGSIKVITELKETTKFLVCLQSIINAFSVHEKHRSYSLKT